MDDLVLTLAAHWLPSIDALACCCVSKRWNIVLSSANDESGLWNQVFSNSHPFLADEVPEATNFHSQCVALLDKGIPTPPVKNYTATLRPEQIFSVIELYRNKRQANGKRRIVVEASWKCPFQQECYDWFDTGVNIVLKGENPYYSGNDNVENVQKWKTSCSVEKSLPHAFAMQNLLGTSYAVAGEEREPLCVKVTLFRRDTLQSVCVLNQGISAEVDDLDGEACHLRGISFLDYDESARLSFVDNGYGQKAESLLYNSDDDGRLIIHLGGCFYSFVQLPGPEEENVPAWLANCYEACQDGRRYEPSARDRRALAKIQYFDIEVGFDIHPNAVVWEHWLDDWPLGEKAKMVILEGLCWE